MHDGHLDVQGGTIRAAVCGASDGLVSNTLLILGVAGADIASGTVRVTGFVGLLAGAVSMAAGEYVSMQAQNELVEAEIAREREAHANEPEHEIEELAELYVERGLEREQANKIARALRSNPEVALAGHTREELGVAPGDLSAPVGAAASSFVAFAIGALLPLVPWFFASGNLAIALSVIVALSGAALIGGILATQTGRSVVRSSARQVAIAAGAAAASYFIGSLLNVQVS